MDILKAAKEALTHPSDFGTTDERLFVDWGFTGIVQTRDSSLREQHNYNTALELLDENKCETRFEDFFWDEDDWDIQGFSHWACGYGDQFICRVLKNGKTAYDDWDEDDITDIFKFFMYLHDELEGYPLLDEDGYSEFQLEESIKALDNMLPGPIDSDGASEILWYAIDSNNYDYDYEDYYSISDDIAYEAAYILGYQDLEWDEDFWPQWEEDNPSIVIQRKNKRWEEAGQQKWSV